MTVDKKRYIKWLVAFGVGFTLAIMAYLRATDPEPMRQKLVQEAVVAESRQILTAYVRPGGELQLVDPLAPDRKIGKTYVWPTDSGWEVSGYYRRGESDVWHPYLMVLDSNSVLVSLAVKDANDRLIGMSSQDERFSAVP